MSSIGRKVASGIVLLFLGLGVLGLVIGDLGGTMGGLQPAQTGGELARVDGRAVTEEDVRDQINRQFQLVRQENPELTMEAFLAEGAFDRVLNQLIVGQALMSFGERQGIVISDRMIDREIVNIPAFQNFAGQFDSTAMRQALAQQGMTEAMLRRDVARSLMQRQLLIPVVEGARMPDQVARQYAGLLLERRRGSVGAVPSDAFRAGIDPSRDEIAAFYRDNQERFVVPERRVLRYAMIGREQVADAARPTEQEIAAFYRDNQARFGGEERRTLQQVVLPDEAAARAFMGRLRGGASFLQAAQQAGFAAGDIAFADQSREAFARQTTPEVANAAFAAEQGAVAGPIRSELGFHVVRVESVSRPQARPLASVRDEIAGEIEQRKLADALGELINRIEDRLAGGASFEEAARGERLEMRETPPVTAAGAAPGQDYSLPEELRPLLRALYQMGPDDEPVVETVRPNERFALMAVGRVTPAAAPPLQQIQAQVREALVRQRALERARAVAQDILNRIQAGTPARQAFAAADPRLPAPQPVNAQRIEISQAGERVPPPLAMLFSIPQGAIRMIEGPDQAGWIIVHHEERTPGNPDDEPQLIEATRSQFAELSADELAEQFARAAEGAADIRRNEAAIQRARQRIAPAAAD